MFVLLGVATSTEGKTKINQSQEVKQAEQCIAYLRVGSPHLFPTLLCRAMNLSFLAINAQAITPKSLDGASMTLNSLSSSSAKW